MIKGKTRNDILLSNLSLLRYATKLFKLVNNLINQKSINKKHTLLELRVATQKKATLLHKE